MLEFGVRPPTNQNKTLNFYTMDEYEYMKKRERDVEMGNQPMNAPKREKNIRDLILEQKNLPDPQQEYFKQLPQKTLENKDEPTRTGNFVIDRLLDVAPKKSILPQELNKSVIETGQKGGQQLAAFSSGAVNSATLGLHDKANELVFGKDAYRDYKTGTGVGEGQNQVAQTLGRIAGYTVPYKAATGALQNIPVVGKAITGLSKGVTGLLAPKIGATAAGIAGNFAAERAVDAGVDVGLGLTEGLIRGDSGKDIAKNIGMDLLMGTGIDAIGAGAKGLKALKQGNELTKGLKEIKDFEKGLKNTEVRGFLDAPLPSGKMKVEQTPLKLLNSKPVSVDYDSALNKNMDTFVKNEKAARQSDYKKAYSDLESTILEVQNKYRVNDLSVDQMNQVKKEFGIDKLIDDFSKAEARLNEPISPEYVRQKIIAGAGSDADYKLLKESGTFKPIEPLLKAKSEVAATMDGGTAVKSIAEDIGIPKPETTNSFINNVAIKPERPKVKLTQNTRQFIDNSVQNSEIATDVMKKHWSNNPQAYKTVTNEESLNVARQVIDSDGYEKSVVDFLSKDKLNGAEDTAKGIELIRTAVNNGNEGMANQITVNLAEKLTKAGQEVQAASIMKRMSPDGMLLYANRQIGNALDSIKDAGTRNFDKISDGAKLSPSDAKFITDKMKNIEGMTDGRLKDIELAKVMQFISNKIPSTGQEKLQAVLRTSMLLNPRTLITRNPIGNLVMGTLENVKQIPSTIADIGFSKFTGNRTTTLPKLKEQVKGFGTGAKELFEDWKFGVDTSPSRGQYELPKGKVFQGKNPVSKTLNALDQTTRKALQLGDRPFYQAAYNGRLEELKKLNNVTEPTAEMIQDSIAMALEKTYQNTTEMSKGLNKIRSGINETFASHGIGTKNFGVGNLILPFTQTPANIFKKGVEYSPLGLVQIITKAAKGVKNPQEQKALVDLIGRTLTGVGITYLGFNLAKNKLATGESNKDEDVRAIELSEGKNPYAIKFGNAYQTIDWAEPFSLPFAIGVDMYNEGLDDGNIVKGIEGGINTLFSQSVVQGLSRFMSGYSPAASIVNSLLGSTSQLTPTAGKQVAELTDKYVRDTSGENKIEQTTNYLKSRVPGLRNTLPQKLDVYGEPIELYQGKGTAEKAFDIFLNPGKNTTYNPNPVNKEVLRLYDETGEKKFFPKVATDKFSDNKTDYFLTKEEQATFQKGMGQANYNDISAEMLKPGYKLMSDKEKAERIEKIIEKNYEEEKKKLIKQRKGQK